MKLEDLKHYSDDKQLETAWFRAIQAINKLKIIPDDDPQFISATIELLTVLSNFFARRKAIADLHSHQLDQEEMTKINDALMQKISTVNRDKQGEIASFTTTSFSSSADYIFLGEIANQLFVLASDTQGSSLKIFSDKQLGNWYKSYHKKPASPRTDLRQAIREYCFYLSDAINKIAQNLFSEDQGWNRESESPIKTKKINQAIKHHITQEPIPIHRGSLLHRFSKSITQPKRSRFEARGRELISQCTSISKNLTSSSTECHNILTKCDLFISECENNFNLSTSRNKRLHDIVTNLHGLTSNIKSIVIQRASFLENKETQFIDDWNRIFQQLHLDVTSYVSTHSSLDHTQINQLVDAIKEQTPLTSEQKKLLRHPKRYRSLLALIILDEFIDLNTGVLKPTPPSYRDYNSAIELLCSLLHDNNRARNAVQSNHFADNAMHALQQPILDTKQTTPYEIIKSLAFTPDPAHNMSWRLRRKMQQIDDRLYTAVSPGKGYFWQSAPMRLINSPSERQAYLTEQIHLFIRDAFQRFRDNSVTIDAIIEEAQAAGLADLHINSTNLNDESYPTVGNIITSYLGSENKENTTLQYADSISESSVADNSYVAMLREQAVEFFIHSTCQRLLNNASLVSIQRNSSIKPSLWESKLVASDPYPCIPFFQQVEKVIAELDKKPEQEPKNTIAEYMGSYPLKYKQQLLQMIEQQQQHPVLAVSPP